VLYRSTCNLHSRPVVSEQCEQQHITNCVAQEPEGSSPHSQQTDTGPCPEPVESNPPPKPVSPRSILIPSSNLRLGLPIGLFFSFGLSHQNLVHIPLLSHACHMPRPPHSPWLDLPNNIWWWVQIMKFLNVQLPSFYRHLIPFTSK
jgi:hypothetical protein